ncbi:MAG: hypothetical protein ACRD3V_26845 [Vicinamibacteria bacterium]
MAGDDLGFELEPILLAIDIAEVLVVRFAFFESRLLVDARTAEGDPPIITLVPQAAAIEERFRSVKRARPRLPLPDRILSFQWPRHAQVMASAGVWTRIVQRLRDSGHSGMEQRCNQVWNEIQLEERREMMRAIRGGERYDTLWERSAGGTGG